MDLKTGRVPKRVCAVLTGDIIKSTALTIRQLTLARELLAEAVRRFAQNHPHAVSGEPEFFRGDAWQFLLKDTRGALRIALLIRATLRAEIEVDTRISIGVGGIDQIDEKNISLSTGEAFTLSGRALDKITGYFDLTGALPERAGALALWFPATLRLCSGLIRPWTRRQAEIVSRGLWLDNPTHERIADSLEPKVSKQTVTESLASAGWRPLLEAIAAFERTDWVAAVGALDT